jgi:hypothetical protein
VSATAQSKRVYASSASRCDCDKTGGLCATAQSKSSYLKMLDVGDRKPSFESSCFLNLILKI